MNKPKSKCDFCKYWTGRGCMVTPNSYFCKEANHEYYQYLKNNQIGRDTKSFRSWDKK